MSANVSIYKEQGGESLVVASGGTVTVESGGVVTLESGSKLVKAVSTVTASTTLTASQSGGIFVVNAADKVMTLPTAAAGLSFTFILGPSGLSTGTGLSISPQSTDAIGGGGLTSVDDKDLILAGASDAEGNTVTLIGTGVDGLEWVIVASTGTWSKEA